MKRLGPDLKMPDLGSLKVPTALQDLYQDLKERRLLPLVGLLVVAIVAVPFLLKGGSPEGEAALAPLPVEPASPTAQEASVSVVPATPGLRDYHKRLSHRHASNPFKPHHQGVPASAEATTTSQTSTTTSSTTTSGGGESSGGGSAAATEAPASPLVPSGESGGAPSGGGGKKGGDEGGGNSQAEEGNLTLFSFAIDVKITKTTIGPKGEKPKSESNERKGVLPPATLPSEKTQVLTYLGISPKTKKPLFLVSEDVQSVFGEVKCVAGSGRCQLIEMKAGFPVTFVYGENGTRYKFNVLDVTPVAVKHS